MALCGPSQAEQNLETQQANMANTMNAAFASRFAGQNQILTNLSGQLNELANGMTPEGFAAPELAAMTTSILNASGAATTQAQQAASNFIAGQGGGAGSGVTSGVQAQIRGAIASQQAGNQAQALANLTQQNYAVGRENLMKSIGGLQSLSGEYNPLGYGTAAQSGTSTAFGEANTINKEQNQALGDIFGAVTGIGKSLIGGGLGVLAGSSTPGVGSGSISATEGSSMVPGLQVGAPVDFNDLATLG